MLAAAIVHWRSGTNFTHITADHTCGGIVQYGVWDAPDCAGRVDPNADIGELAEGRGKLGEARATADSEVSKSCHVPKGGLWGGGGGGLGGGGGGGKAITQ